MNPKILVTGGCGYIGSHTIVDLLENNFDVVSVDDLSRSSSQVLKGIEKITNVSIQNYPIDLCDIEATRKIFESEKNIVGIIHFAAYKYVPESVEKPILYYHNNLESLNNILTCAKEFEVKNVVFSSSCSVYGNVTELPVVESTPLKKAESPYARTKQMGEDILEDFAIANSYIKNIALRYFNPVGAHESVEIGESPTVTPNNLVPRITGTAIGKFEKLIVFGHELPTRDGTCIRDYIHVMDIAHAHTKALQYLIADKNESNFEVINIGSGKGVSVLEAIKAFEKISEKKLNYELSNPRQGDVIAVYADNTYAKDKLKWEAKRDIEDMMKTAWAWELKNSSSK